jgi:pimeloyl-ACP methyl ester carboxylesterase
LTQPNITAAQLASIKPRTLLLNGVGDENLTRQSVQAMADAMPQAKFVLIPGVGHYAPKQTPDAFNKTVLDFLKGK